MLKLPVIQGLIDRRVLVNYRCDPQHLARLLPPPFRPKLVKEVGMAGICLIRLRQIRPHGVPRFLGLGSENAAHRIAVQWTDAGRSREVLRNRVGHRHDSVGPAEGTAHQPGGDTGGADGSTP